MFFFPGYSPVTPQHSRIKGVRAVMQLRRKPGTMAWHTALWLGRGPPNTGPLSPCARAKIHQHWVGKSVVWGATQRYAFFANESCGISQDSIAGAIEDWIQDPAQVRATAANRLGNPISLYYRGPPCKTGAPYRAIVSSRYRAAASPCCRVTVARRRRRWVTSAAGT